MKKKFFVSMILVLAICVSSANVVFASSNKYDGLAAEYDVYTEYFDDGSYIVTKTNVDNVISSLLATNATNSTASGYTISTYYSASNVALCALKITGKFSYNGSTVSCTSKSATKYSYDSDWSVEDVTTSSGKNTSSTQAYAKADGNFVHRLLGVTIKKIATSSIVYCDKNGKIY